MAGFGGYDGDDVVVKGDDGTPKGKKIGVVDDRLKVTGNLAPLDCVVPLTTKLENGGSDDMTVNGSGTPVDFVDGPPAGQVWYMTGVQLVLIDPGTMDPDDFGSIGGLTNGFGFVVEVNSTEYDVNFIFNNKDLATELPDRHIFTSIDSGFFTEDDVFIGGMIFNPPIKLDGDNGDQMIARVRDNLTGISHLEVAMQAWRVI